MDNSYYRGEIYYINNDNEYIGNVQGGGETCGNRQQ